ncbi:MAG: SIR2 family protein [Pseudomonadota bacterium]
MVESLFIFGNGLGRAISNDYFSLERVLRDAWDSGDVLTDRQKQLIQSCLSEDVLDDEEVAPTSEAELDDLHRVLSACDTIRSFEDRIPGQDGNWLSQLGLEFPAAIRRYIHNAACRFNSAAPGLLDANERCLPDMFEQALRTYIMDVGAHIATLNYDDLLYECFSETEVFQKIRLRDGFFNGKFDFPRHEGYYNPTQEGWFLHLHGSPLFVNRMNEPRKINRAELAEYVGVESTHLVLTSVRYKSSVIQSSEILRVYWTKLKTIVPHCKNIVLVGYGGADTHLNDVLTTIPDDASLRVVEYDGGSDYHERRNMWVSKLENCDVKLIRMKDILQFDDWQN